MFIKQAQAKRAGTWSIGFAFHHCNLCVGALYKTREESIHSMSERELILCGYSQSLQRQTIWVQGSHQGKQIIVLFFSSLNLTRPNRIHQGPYFQGHPVSLWSITVAKMWYDILSTSDLVIMDYLNILLIFHYFAYSTFLYIVQEFIVMFFHMIGVEQEASGS